MPTIDLDTLLYGQVTPEQVTEFFRDGEFPQECYLVEAIERHLQNEQQREILYLSRLSIEKLLNGRYGGEFENLVATIFAEWNAKLGFRYFGGTI